MRNILKCKFDMNPSIEYPLVVGNTYTDNFNEQIDSIAINIDDVSADKRLVMEEPYHFVKIINYCDDLTLEEYEEEYPETLTENRIVNHVVTYNHDIEVGDTLRLQMTNENFNYPVRRHMKLTEYASIKGVEYIIQATVTNVKEIGHTGIDKVEYRIDSIREANYDEGFKWNGKNYKFMAVDSMVETEVNMIDHIYRYEIKLMNCIKIFEKIQCPNLMVTHSLVDGSKTIYEYIDAYMKLYCPKIKMTEDGVNWHYDYMFDWSQLNIRKFNKVCADLQFNEPTLREVLTQLMLQVDCIPTCDYRTLGFIDFREKPTTFNPTYRCNKVESLASDSYNTSLTISPTQVLDSGNKVVTEQVGFRDRTNAILSQLSNLQIETRFPIYHIEKVELVYAGSQLIPTPENQHYYTIYSPSHSELANYPVLSVVSEYDSYHNYNPRIITGTNKIRIPFCYFGPGTTGAVRKGVLKNIKVHFCKLENGFYKEDFVLDSGESEWDLDWDSPGDSSIVQTSLSRNTFRELFLDGTFGNLEINSSLWYYWVKYYYINLDLPVEYDSDIHKYAWFENDFIDHSQNDEVVHQFLPVRQGENDGTGITFKTGLQYNCTNTFKPLTITEQGTIYSVPSLVISNFYSNMDLVPFFSINGANLYSDITNLVFESSKRQLLETDVDKFDYLIDNFNLFQPDYFPKFIYGTLGYNIGGKTITGFSSSYSKVELWWNRQTSYFDAILSYLNAYNLISYPDVDYNSSDIQLISQKIGNMPINKNTITLEGTTQYPVPDNNKGKYFFNITYQPLNNVKLKFPKEDKNIPLDLTTLNNSENGLSDFDRLTKYSQSMADRTGNKVIQIGQTLDDLSELMPLNSIYDNKYIVFKREIAIYENYLTVLYTLSEKYVLQNYFTSIITKYRAYEYIDYEGSTIRKENLTIYCLLSADKYYDGDDHIKWKDSKFESYLLSGLDTEIMTGTGSEAFEEFDYSKSVNYIVRKSLNSEDEDESTKEELSLVTYKNGFAIVFEEFDNVSAGLYLLSATIPNDEGALGGTGQKWQMWESETYNESQEICFVSKLFMSTYGQLAVNTIIKFPILDDNVIYEDFIIFNIVDNKSVNYYTYSKDISEIINQTVQFYFYSDTDEIEFTQAMFDSCAFIKNNELHVTTLFMAPSDAELVENHTTSDRDKLTERTVVPYGLDYFYLGYDEDKGKYYICIDWGALANYEGDKVILSYYRVTGTYPRQTHFYNDFMSFKRRDTETKYYLTLNDTKTNDVWYFKSEDDLFETYECDNGSVRTCHIKETI